MAAKRIVVVVGIAGALLVAAWAMGQVPGLGPIQGVLAAFALVGILVTGLLGVVGLNRQQDRAEGLAEAKDKPSWLEEVEERCLPFASLTGLLLSAAVAILSFALLCHCLYENGLEHWFRFAKGGQHLLPEWIWFSFLQAFRAADLPDMLESQALEYGMEMPKLLRPIQGTNAAAVSLISGYRIAIGTLLISQAISIWLRRRRIRKAVEALRDSKTRQAAQRTLVLNTSSSLGPLRRVFRDWKTPPDPKRWRRLFGAGSKAAPAAEPDWLLAALEVCRDLGTDAGPLEDHVRSLLDDVDGEVTERLRQAAIHCLAAVTPEPLAVAHRIDRLWLEAESMEEERRGAWKGTLGKAIEHCRDRLLASPPADLEASIAKLEFPLAAESTIWLLWHLRNPPDRPARWPMIALLSESPQPTIVEANAAVRPSQLRVEPLDEDDEPLRLDECLEEYMRRVRLPPDLEIGLGEGVAMRFLLVPAGLYQRGNVFDADTGDKIERPHHPVALRSPFYLQDTQVTCAQFGRFLASEAGAEFRQRLREQRELSEDPEWYDVVDHHAKAPDGYADHPLAYASWSDGRAFCRWLTDENLGPIEKALPEEANPILASLPTEAEWEWAAKGPGLFQYPWGNKLDQTQLCFFLKPYDVDPPATQPVRSYKDGRSWCGLYDMAGNLYSWADDQFEEYDRMPQDELADDPVGITRQPSRVQRGGAWCYTDWDSRCTYRYATELEDSRDEDGGFRVALVFGRPRAL